MSAAPRPKSSSPITVASNGSESQLASSPGGTTSVCPANANSGPDVPCVAQKLSTSPNRIASTENPACLRRETIASWHPASSGVTDCRAINSRVRASVASSGSVIGMQHLVELDGAFVSQTLHCAGRGMSTKQ